MRKGTVAMVMGKCMWRSSPDLLISMLTCEGGREEKIKVTHSPLPDAAWKYLGCCISLSEGGANGGVRGKRMLCKMNGIRSGSVRWIEELVDGGARWKKDAA